MATTKKLAASQAEAATPAGHSKRGVARLAARTPVSVGERLELCLNPENLHFFDAARGETLRGAS